MYFTWISGVETIECRLELRMAVWLQAKVHECGLGMWPRLNAGPVCDAQRLWVDTCRLWRCIGAELLPRPLGLSLIAVLLIKTTICYLHIRVNSICLLFIIVAVGRKLTVCCVFPLMQRAAIHPTSDQVTVLANRQHWVTYKVTNVKIIGLLHQVNCPVSTFWTMPSIRLVEWHWQWRVVHTVQQHCLVWISLDT